MISDIIYTRARREAWSDGLALHSEPLQDQREKLITLIDRKAVRAANKALFWDLPPVRLMCQAARKLEDAFAGNWSELVSKRVRSGRHLNHRGHREHRGNTRWDH